MTLWWGRTIYWIATIIACLIVLWDGWNYVFGANNSNPVINISPLLAAGVIWLAGLVCRKLAR
jgi:hypothetical protein